MPPRAVGLSSGFTVTHRGEAGWDALAAHFPAIPGARQIFDLTIDLVQTSCGYGVPFHDYVGERPTMDKWAAAKGPDGIEQYWHDKNLESMDGLPTGLLADPEPAE